MTEYSLHAAIKNWYSVKGAKVETKVQNFIIDVKKEELLIEIQTSNFFPIKPKLTKLLPTNRVRLVYPIAKLKWIVYVSKSGEFIKKRKSPKKGKTIDLFNEMVHIPELVSHENFSFEVMLIEEEELRCDDGEGTWRRKGISIKDRKLLKVFKTVLFKNKNDFLNFLPYNFNERFTNRKIANKLKISLRLARKITYCLRKMNLVTIVGKKKREFLFKINN
jgi:hypothetical protein